MSTRILTALILVAAPLTAACGKEPMGSADWYLVVRTFKGGLSIVGSLTEDKCRSLERQLAFPRGCPDGEMVCEMIRAPDDISRADCFQ